MWGRMMYVGNSTPLAEHVSSGRADESCNQGLLEGTMPAVERAQHVVHVLWKAVKAPDMALISQSLALRPDWDRKVT